MSKTHSPVSTAPTTDLVVRSAVPPGKPYREYLEYLRPDFYFSCAYCTMSEFEAQGIRMTIDHYEPQKTRPDLTDDYNNLMYACDVCNTRKGARSPSSGLRARGFRYFRPDHDAYADHFERSDRRVSAKTEIGTYTIDGVDLNRQALQRLRALRKRAAECDEFVAGGLTSLKRFPIDRLPRHIRGQAHKAIVGIENSSRSMIDSVEGILQAYGRSPFLDEDAEARSRARERSQRLAQLEGSLRPGAIKGGT